MVVNGDPEATAGELFYDRDIWVYEPARHGTQQSGFLVGGALDSGGRHGFGVRCRAGFRETTISPSAQFAWAHLYGLVLACGFLVVVR